MMLGCCAKVVCWLCSTTISKYQVVRARTHCTVIQKAFPAAGITPRRQAFNTHMSGARQSVEWGFAEIITKWAYVDFKKQQKIGLQAVGLHYRVAAFLTNCRTILRGGNKASRFFRVDPPTLAVYLQGSYSCNGVPYSQCKRLDQPVHQM